jgi:hypothetical protein
MGRRKKFVAPEIANKFQREFMAELPNGRTIEAGEHIKIIGEHGMIFKFHALTTNIETGVSWIDCHQIEKTRMGALRSFYIERVKKIPVRRKRVRREQSN